jgi:ComF family protein
LKQSVIDLKYNEHTIVAPLLARTLTSFMPPAWKQHVLMPVPLHPLRLAERGFNQSALLARGVASRTNMHLALDAVRRTRATTAQARLKSTSRGKNVSGAFSLSDHARPLPPQVVLLDDVVTTGCTVDACAQPLREAGVSVVGVLTCALGGRNAHSTRRAKTQ